MAAFPRALRQMSGASPPMSAVDIDDLDEYVPPPAPSTNGGQGGAPGYVDQGTSGALAPAPQVRADAPFQGDPGAAVAQGIRRALEGKGAPVAAAGLPLPSADSPNIVLPDRIPYSSVPFPAGPDGGGPGAGIGIDLAGQMGTGRNPYIPDALAARDQEGARLQRGSMLQSQALQEEAGIYDSQARAQVPLVAGQMRVLGDARSYALQKRQGMEEASQMYADAVSRGIRPDRLFDSGRVNRVQAVINAGAAGAVDFYFNDGRGGNKARDLLDRMIDRDISVQEADIAAKGQNADNLLAQLQVALGDKEDAADTFRAMYLSLMEKEAQAAMTRTADAKQRSALEAMLGQIQVAKSDLLLSSEEKYLDRRLKADEENLQQRNALQMKAMETQAAGKQRGAAQLKDFTEKFGPKVELTRRRRQLLSLMQEAKQKFGQVPGLGVIDASTPFQTWTKVYSDFTSGPDAPTDPEQRDYARRIAQLGREVDVLVAQTNRGPGAQSDYDQAINQGAYGIMSAMRDEIGAEELLRRGEVDMANQAIAEGKVLLDEPYREYWFRQMAPEWLNALPSAGGVEKTPY